MLRSLFISIGMIFFLSGCSTNKLAFHSNPEEALSKSDPIILFTAHLRNDYRISIQPTLMGITIHSLDDEGEDVRSFFNAWKDDSALLKPEVEEEGDEYLISIQLKPDHFELTSISSMGQIFPFFGEYLLTLELPFDVEDGHVYYLGHIEGVIRERQGDEERAGSVIPLIDQAIIGASGGTWDVEISDRYEEDMKKFVERFPVLENVVIEKQVLPFIKRAAASEHTQDS
ncbi:hypothetical protein [Neptunomonas phycophila]|uniref:hypothetical protein n=1 Tax=Neptunomonas phycophila TaxID=1572645 RepID=UPI0023F8043A|nr:hypothetical protein [Neptunomonas phycophila]